MPDAVELVKTMKKAAIDAVESTKPVNVYFGIVINDSPLQINVEQKMLLGKNQLILSRNVTEFKMMVTVQWKTESALSTHNHTVKGKDNGNDDIDLTTGDKNLRHEHDIAGQKEITVHNQLKKGEEVILIRQQEGQKYIVIDRIGVME